MKTSGHKAWLVQKLVRYIGLDSGRFAIDHSAQEVWVGPSENASQEVMHIYMGYDHSFPSEHRNTTFGHDLNHIWTDCWHLPLKTCSDNDELDGSSIYDLQWVDCTSSDWLYLRFFGVFRARYHENCHKKRLPSGVSKEDQKKRRMGCKNHYLKWLSEWVQVTTHKMRFRTKKNVVGNLTSLRNTTHFVGEKNGWRKNRVFRQPVFWPSKMTRPVKRFFLA